MAERFAEVSVVTHDGLVRDHNEDSVVVGPWTACATVTTAPATPVRPLEVIVPPTSTTDSTEANPTHQYARQGLDNPDAGGDYSHLQ
jgi:hypothetical protein